MNNFIPIDRLVQMAKEPNVPKDLLRYTCGMESMEEFLWTGAEVYLMLDMAARQWAKKSLQDFTNILDFGCGNGRLLRFLSANAPPPAKTVFQDVMSTPH